MIQTKKIYWADKLGAISAILCIIHCLAVPALLSLGMGFISNPIIAYLFIAIAFVSIYKATNGRFLKPISIFLWLAFIGFFISMLLENQAEVFEYTMFLFSGLIILGHLYNMRYCNK
ncbi:MerC domain-containing protein [Winogradskyella psychrotolerans]|uniref:MerC domain-containing protein n=1 Tax=Winogradskyella psychrotolerans TaxID=1344585 RepID=UPI001C072E52|nr:MerC domain-containing protein [Winogradskyella psychrotolerans]MBU2928560.1 MerC domain-containing protein [Winogradskyella psychrotolerans]